jgi:hypothetical protein
MSENRKSDQRVKMLNSDRTLKQDRLVTSPDIDTMCTMRASQPRD